MFLLRLRTASSAILSVVSKGGLPLSIGKRFCFRPFLILNKLQFYSCCIFASKSFCEQKGASVIMSVVREGNHERAWNDPPQFGYATNSAGASSRPRTQLNKRVPYLPPGMTPKPPSTSPSRSTGVTEPIPLPGFPPDQNGSLPSSNINVFTPPDFYRPSATIPCQSPPSQIDGKIDIRKVPNIDSTEMLSQIDTNISKMLKQIQPNVSERKLEDIKRRLDVMRSQWMQGKLSDTTRKRMYLLARGISECDFNEAARLQVSLIRDSSCEVSQWIVGVKHVILECQAQNIRK